MSGIIHSNAAYSSPSMVDRLFPPVDKRLLPNESKPRFPHVPAFDINESTIHGLVARLSHPTELQIDHGTFTYFSTTSPN